MDKHRVNKTIRKKSLFPFKFALELIIRLVQDGRHEFIIKCFRPSRWWRCLHICKMQHKLLGVCLNLITTQDNIDYIASKVSSRLGLLGRIGKYISADTCKQLHCSLIQPLYEYCDVVWSNADKTHLQCLLRLQKRGAGLILKRKTNDCKLSALFKELGWVNLTDRWSFNKCETVYRCLNHFCPSYLSNLSCLNSDVHNYNTRRKNDFHLAKIGSKSGERSFTFKAAKLFNSLISTTKSAKSVTSFTNLYNYWRETKQYV